MAALSSLPNIGAAIEWQLRTVGIRTAAELRAVGAEQAWLRLSAVDSSAGIQRLLALEGALLGVKKAELSEERRAELLAFCGRHRS
jgi:TfoX C-terminal domain.